jgi:hypothetical protein
MLFGRMIKCDLNFKGIRAYLYWTGVEGYNILSETFALDSITDLLKIIWITKKRNNLHKVFHSLKFMQKYKKIQLNLLRFWNSFTHFEPPCDIVVSKSFII